MAEDLIPSAILTAIRAGGEALDRGERGPAQEIAILRDANLLTAPLPLNQGGRGWGTSPQGSRAICDILIALGSASLPVARLYEGHVNAVRLMVRFGTGAQQCRLAQDMRNGAMLGVWGADSEQGVVIEDERLCGTKSFASGLGDLTTTIVTARCESGLQMVLVSADDPARADHSDWDMDGMVGSRSGRFGCDGLAATADHRLGPVDALFVEPDFHGGIWRLAACYAGAMQRLAEISAEIIERRGQSAAPLMQARLGSIVVESETAAVWSRHAAQAVEAQDADRAEAIYAALFAREAVEHAANRMLATVERIAGTAMHRKGSEAGRIARDLRLYLRQADLDGKLAMATSDWLRRRQSCD